MMEKAELRGEHLKNSNFLIKACAYNNTNLFKLPFFDPDADFISYTISKHRNYLNKIGAIYRKRLKNIVFSSINSNDKYSTGYFNCTGIIAIGKDKVTGKDISFLSHQSPMFFLVGKGKKEFKEILTFYLEELKDYSLEGSIDVLIFGGNYKGEVISREEYVDYKIGIKTLNEIIYDTLGFNAVVIGGPNGKSVTGDGKWIYVNTQQRKVYYTMDTDNILKNKDFVANKVNDLIF